MQPPRSLRSLPPEGAVSGFGRPRTTDMDHRLLQLLVCPICKGPLTLLHDAQRRPEALACPADHLAFPIRDGIPVMLEQEARPTDEAGEPPTP